ncbi:hypothetical protein SPAN111604_01340 [Sphingomonas antarctica]|uniref:hypothetical protein n=1 Tax=Sphingomonas antarctica TaxID=2040274 RepID=UPI0039EA1852
MKNDTYFAGAKPAIERVMRSFERSRHRVEFEIEPLTGMVRAVRASERPLVAAQFAGAGDSTTRYLDEAIERCARIADMRRRIRREQSADRRARAKLVAITPRTSGEV